MTRFLVGRPLTTEPYLEIYENNNVGNPPPVRLGFKPGIAGVVAGLKFSASLKLLAVVTNARRTTVPGIGNPAQALSNSGIKVFSPEDNYVLFGGDASTLAGLFYRRGPYYLPVPAAKVPLPTTVGQYVIHASLSAQGNVLMFITNDAPTILKICDKTVDAITGLDTWTQKATATLTVSDADVYVSPNSLYAVATSPSAGTVTVLKLVGTVYTPIPRSGANPIRAAVVRSDGNLYVIEKSVTAGTAAVVYKYDGTNWTLVQTLPIDTTSGGVSSGYKFSADGDTLAYCYTRTAASTAALLTVGRWNGTTFQTMLALVASPRYPNVTTCIISADGMSVAVSYNSIGASPQNPTVRLYALTTVGTTTTMALTHEWITSASTMQAKSFSPDKTVLHTGNGSNAGQHFSTSSPFAELTTIPEAPGVAASSVWSVVYGNVGQASFALSGASLIPVIRDGKGSYLDARTLEGTFVTLYDRKVGTPDTFYERNFIQHIVGTEVSDIVFSPDSRVMLYHTTRPGVTDQSGLGRFVYDISAITAITYKGAIYLASDEASFAAVNASSSYFVVCFRNPTNGNNIKLYKLDATFAYTQKDSRLVEYGPVAFSVCETVVVAHGGLIPYTLYVHQFTPTDILVIQAVAFTDWDRNSDILAVAFTPDCNGVVIVTPDEIVLADTDTGDEDDSAPHSTPPDAPPSIDQDPDTPDKMIIVDRNHDGGSSNSGAGAGTGVNGTTKTVDKFEYTPYVAINITYRTW